MPQHHDTALFKAAEIELVYRSKVKAKDRPLVNNIGDSLCFVQAVMG